MPSSGCVSLDDIIFKTISHDISDTIVVLMRDSNIIHFGYIQSSFQLTQAREIIPLSHQSAISTNSRKIFLISLYIYLENGNIYKRQTKKTLADKT